MALIVRARLGFSAFSSACSLPISLDNRRARDCGPPALSSSVTGAGLAGGVFTIPAFRRPLQARALSTSKAALAKARGPAPLPRHLVLSR